METDNKRKALGKGLEQLFSNESLFLDDIEKNIVNSTKVEDIVEVKISELRSNPYQPRQTFDQEKLVELANSIKEHGVLEPIIVSKSIKGYEIVAGERRKKASELIGLETIPAIIKDFTDEEMMEIALLENIQREDLSAIEEAEAYGNLIKALGITQNELADKIGKSRVYITNMLGLLRLPESVKNDILHGFISLGHAKILSKLDNPDVVINLATKVKNDHLSVRDLEDVVGGRNYKRTNVVNQTHKPSEYQFVEDVMKEKIGTNVKIKSNNIVIPFDSPKDLERILDILNIEVKID